MTDIALANAIAKRNEIKARRDLLAEEVAHLDSQIAVIDGFIEQWHAFAEGRVTDDVRESGVVAAQREPTIRKRSRPVVNPRKEDVARVAADIIREKGRPVPRAEMLADLQERGITLNGTDPMKVLSTMLWRMSDVVSHVPRRGYFLANMARDLEGPETDATKDEDFVDESIPD